MTPKRQRHPVGRMLSGDGTVGLAYYAGDGDVQLYDANETLETAAC